LEARVEIEPTTQLRMAFFDLNPTFTALKTPFCPSYGVVLRCFWMVMALTVD
jgi:hypothetical protein